MKNYLELFKDDFGTTIRVHTIDKCRERHCVIHNPSKHHMRNWKLLWRKDKQCFERICKHGVGHPDPDDVAYHILNGRSLIGIHGCDGCCIPSKEER